MKIFLIRYHDTGDVNTRLPESLNKVRGVMPPLGLAYVAAVLESAGYDVRIIDAMASNLIADDIRQIFQKEKPDIVGVTSMLSNLKGALEAARLAKEAGAITVIGGPLLSLYPKQTLSYDVLDYGVIGEGEYPMLELVKALEQKLNLSSVPGLVYKENGVVKANDPYIVSDLDKLPLPARHLLPIDKYSSIINHHPITTMIASRGCPYKCGFCVKGPSDKKCRFRDPKKVVDEMEMLVKKYKIKEIMFYDDTLTSNRRFVFNVCNEIVKRNLKVRWESPTRVDCIDAELLRLMKKAGCIRLRYGVESGDERILKIMNKGIDLRKVKEAFRLTRNIGIETFAYFIIGYIYDTEESMSNTISFARTLNPDFAMFTIATPYPTTSLQELAVKERLMDAGYWEQVVLNLRNDRLNYLVPDADAWIQKAYKGFYFRPNYMFRRLLKIRTLDDVKKHFQALRSIAGFKLTDEVNYQLNNG
ncbi:MAG: B12-binding domain-containing radical SAM protein [Candidatus Omnitrophica bacterium]|nr:B12-binding domain-containing radical SAM protein [Candidatus Omnitrophota bacterium]